MELTDTRFRAIVLALIVVLAGGFAVLLAGPGEGARQDLSSLEDDLTAQRELTEELLERLESQEQITAETRDEVQRSRQIAERSEELAERAAELGEQQLNLSEALLSTGEETEDLLRESIAIQRQILEETRELNESFPSEPGQTAPID